MRTPSPCLPDPRVLQVQGGDRIRILTPGGGGYGPPEGVHGQQHDGAEAQQQAEAADSQVAAARRRSGGVEFSAPVRDGGSLQRYARHQKTV